MLRHYDSPTAIADGRITLCVFYAFSAASGTTAPCPDPADTAYLSCQQP
jgi:hypothetical protein